MVRLCVFCSEFYEEDFIYAFDLISLSFDSFFITLCPVYCDSPRIAGLAGIKSCFALTEQ
ncbi:hypothetical protein LCGC14_1829710, partial [marine sediment metagenome]